MVTSFSYIADDILLKGVCDLWIKEQVERIVLEKTEMSKNTDSSTLASFYQEMRRRGVALKKDYDLPIRSALGSQFDNRRASPAQDWARFQRENLYQR